MVIIQNVLYLLKLYIIYINNKLTVILNNWGSFKQPIINSSRDNFPKY